jgi:cellulose synthase/poly-beta-1,6-N-acetylglucosamine synthase-like glycosyltransferase
MEIGTAATYSLLFVSLFFEVFLLVAFLERKFEARFGGARLPVRASGYEPTVAIVIPCLNEEHSLTGTLQSLLNLDYPSDKFEVIIVDDGSQDATLSIARSFSHDRRVKIFTKENGGKHTAMNIGLANTNAELIGCLDADSIVAPDALRKIIPVFANQHIAAATPGIHVRDPKTWLQSLQNVEYRLSLFNRFIFAALGSVFITPGPFSIFRAAVIRELGGWRFGHSTEDMEMALRIQKAGYFIANVPKAVVHTTTPRHIRGLFHQRVRWTYGWLRNAIDYRSMIGNRRFGNLGIIVLPSALISIVTVIYFFSRIVIDMLVAIFNGLSRFELTGALPTPSLNLFYFNTNAILFLIWFAVALMLVLISVGSLIGTGSRRVPMSTPFFLAVYGFLVPLWLVTAVVRAAFKTGVRWR